MSDVIGQSVGGYPVEKQLGKGSYSTTWLAKTSAAPLAVKLLREDLHADSALNKAISYGWESARQVLHPNLAIMYSAGIDPKFGAYCLEEVVQGKSLREFILQGAKVAWRDSLILAEQLFGALQALHQAGRCHGDIWPSNILITQDQDLKLEGSGGLTLLDRLPTDVVQGPGIGYFAPENLQGSPPSAACDLYAAGACLYFIMAGRDPYPGDKADTIVRGILERNAPPLSAWRDDLTPEAGEFVARLMAKDPTQRYGDIGAVIADVERMKNGKPLAPLAGGKPAAAPVLRSIKGPPSGGGAQRLTPAPQPSHAHGFGGLRQAGVSGLGGRAAGLSGARAGVTGSSLPALAGASGMQRKISSGLSPAARSGTGIRVFGQLDTQVKSTIPQSDLEKKGDDCYRQGQLPLALNCWREAMEGAPHTALKVKIELGERDVRKETFQLSLDEARHRALIGDYRGAIGRAQEALLNADTEQQRTEAMKIETEAGRAAQAAEKARKLKLAVLGIGGVMAVVVLFVVFRSGAKNPQNSNVTPAPLAPDPATPAASGTAQKVQKTQLPNLDIYVVRPANWTLPETPLGPVAMLGNDPKGGTVMMQVAHIGAGMIFSTRFGELRARPLIPAAKTTSAQEIFCWIDGALQCGEIVYAYKEAGRDMLRLSYLVGSPGGALYLAEFFGAREEFTPRLQEEARGIMRSWSYQKP